MQETIDLLTIWLGNVVDLLEPEVIVIGGGLGSRIPEWFQQIVIRFPSGASIHARMRYPSCPPSTAPTRVSPAQLHYGSANRKHPMLRR